MIPAALATALHLHTIHRHWNDLAELAATRAGDAWPPASLNAYLRTVEEYDPMDRSAPVRLHILDTIRTVEAVLVDTADRTAAQVQRPAMSHAPRDTGWTPADRAARDQVADADAADPRRWQYHGQRTGAQAADWLARRVLGTGGGPFRPLTAAEQHHIATVAAGAAERVEHALGLTRRTVEITGRRCACTGRLYLHGGDGRTPEIVCSGCGRRHVQQPAAA
ncbi:hypothetical protein [Streptomyces sp. WMMC897]|uniref:hypothetical protein n=1 Tax=Streptomyces sp. WMMC897 TaxID=3014782 RepID=UPI0022B65564|nr:hypothetical protein [Streptomyces sp. WMMC897]MCZ7413133.1 hypothetical protein [Streptomyces sp. WMMC897]MCZ7415483.1 hypothetical protein [Streptomyces sp. WMMC897]